MDSSLLRSLGAIYYRAGRFEEAQTQLMAAIETPEMDATYVAYTWYLLAMTNHRLGQSEEAKSWLGKATSHTAKALADDRSPDGSTLSWQRRLTLERLDAEARTLLADNASEEKP